MLSLEVSRDVSKLRLRGCRGRTTSLTGDVSDLGVMASLDMRDGGNLLADDDEFWRPNSWLRFFVTEPLAPLCKAIVSLEIRYSASTHIAQYPTIFFHGIYAKCWVTRRQCKLRWSCLLH